MILAEAGRREHALARVEQNLRHFPDDLWTQIHAGDVHLALSDPARAEEAFRDALATARAGGDSEGVADANERLSRLREGAAPVLQPCQYPVMAAVEQET